MRRRRGAVTSQQNKDDLYEKKMFTDGERHVPTPVYSHCCISVTWLTGRRLHASSTDAVWHVSVISDVTAHSAAAAALINSCRLTDPAQAWARLKYLPPTQNTPPLSLPHFFSFHLFSPKSIELLTGCGKALLVYYIQRLHHRFEREMEDSSWVERAKNDLTASMLNVWASDKSTAWRWSISRFK